MFLRCGGDRGVCVLYRQAVPVTDITSRPFTGQVPARTRCQTVACQRRRHWEGNNWYDPLDRSLKSEESSNYQQHRKKHEFIHSFRLQWKYGSKQKWCQAAGQTGARLQVRLVPGCRSDWSQAAGQTGARLQVRLEPGCRSDWCQAAGLTGARLQVWLVPGCQPKWIASRSPFTQKMAYSIAIRCAINIIAIL